jgi:hypothetical protein
MRKVVVLAAIVALALAASAFAVRGGHVKAPLVPVNGSGVTGFVQLQQLPHGGTNIHVHARGLEPGASYTSFYYDNTTCSEGPDLIGEFTANAAGVGNVHDKADEDLDEIGSVSVRVPFYGTLLACAATQ